MKISDLIEYLEAIKIEHGDLECFAYGVDGGMYGLSEPKVQHDVKVDSWSDGTGDKTYTGIDEYADGEQSVVTI